MFLGLNLMEKKGCTIDEMIRNSYCAEDNYEEKSFLMAKDVVSEKALAVFNKQYF